MTDVISLIIERMIAFTLFVFYMAFMFYMMEQTAEADGKKQLGAVWLAVLACHAGLFELATIYEAYSAGKVAIMPFIHYSITHFGIAGLAAVATLRILLVWLAYNWRYDYINAALMIWWGAWIWLNSQ